MKTNLSISTFTKILKQKGIPEPKLEYRFAPPRRWRIDICWPEQKIAVEIEGGVWIRGRHNRGKGFLADMEKYNTMTMMGYRLYRFTPEQLKNGVALSIIEGAFKSHE